MTDAADILNALDIPAAVVDAAGAVTANAAFDAAGGAAALAVRPGETLRTGFDAAALAWTAKALPGGARLISGRAAGGGRDRFLAALSHELRTPLNGVLGMAGLLEATPLAAEQRVYVAAVRDSGEHLLGMVNDVLDLAKLDAGKLVLETAPVEIDGLLQSVCELLSPRAHAKGLEIAWSAPGGSPPVMADDGRLRQILFNLAGNAVKFTERGGVILGVEAAGAANGRSRLRFTVRDTGPGVPEAAREEIFEEFGHADPRHGARLDSTGLGLAIVRRLAAAFAGRVGVDSAPGQGSQFWFEAEFDLAGTPRTGPSLKGVTVAVASPSAIVREALALQVAAAGGQVLACETAEAAEAAPAGAVVLIDHACAGPRRLVRPLADRPCLILLAPEERTRIGRYRAKGFAGYLIKPLRQASVAARVLAVLDGAAAAPHDERAAAARPLGLRVLLAEDNPINALLARTLLEREGCSVERAADGAEAVAAAGRSAFDLILMDVRMPGMDGLTAARTLRTQGVAAPIIALTADAFEEDRRACLAAGMNDFLTKPLDRGALKAVIARASAAATSPPAARRAQSA